MPPAPRRSLIPILRRRNERGEAEASLLLFPRGIPFEGTPDGSWTGGASGDAVGAVINRPGDSAPAGGRFHGGCAPHSLFVLDKKRMRRARWKRKNRLGALRCSGPPRDGGRRIGACSDFAWPSGTLSPSAIPATTVPWQMVRRASGCKDVFDQLLFPRVPLRYALAGRVWEKGNKKERTAVRSFLFVL